MAFGSITKDWKADTLNGHKREAALLFPSVNGSFDGSLMD